MENFIIIAILVAIIGCAIAYIVKAKKKGVKCVGCPNTEMCQGNCSGCSYNRDNK